jgi:hypothetical protein
MDISNKTEAETCPDAWFILSDAISGSVAIATVEC